MSLLPWRGRVGAPGECQSRPTLPSPRRLQGFFHPVTTIAVKPNLSQENQTTNYPISSPVLVFNPSNNHFILNSSCFLPENNFTTFPRKVLLWQSTAERKNERKKESRIKYCFTIPFISFARFRLHSITQIKWINLFTLNFFSVNILNY